MNKQLGGIKRYHIGKVYRRDQPALTKGRFREFYQCDFDIAGAGLAPLLPDAEVFKVIVEILSELEVGAFEVKCNSRKVLDGLFAVCGVPEDRFRAVCSAVDKLDKLPWAEVRREIVSDKGIAEDVADLIGSFVVGKRGGLALLDELLATKLAENPQAKEGLEELRTLGRYFEIYGIADKVVFDMSLARGLDYYTGVILEAVLTEGGSSVGSIAGGGRYDNLVGMFMKSGQQMPCVGASVGVERVFSILEARYTQQSLAKSPVQVFVAAAGGDLLEERMRLCAQLWSAGLNAEMLQKQKVKALDQFSHCEKNGIPLVVVLGPGEYAAGQAKLRVVATREETLVSLADIVPQVKAKLDLINVNGALTKLTLH